LLDDLLPPGLRLVICGTAAGERSAKLGAYYAGRGNKFWRTLHEVGLTPDRTLIPSEFRELLSYGIGLTDLAKGVSGMNHTLMRHSFDRPDFGWPYYSSHPARLHSRARRRRASTGPDHQAHWVREEGRADRGNGALRSAFHVRCCERRFGRSSRGEAWPLTLRRVTGTAFI
jgi:hypothetical protein